MLPWPNTGHKKQNKHKKSAFIKKITKSRRKLRQCRNFLRILVSAFYSAEMPKFSFGLHAKNRLGSMPQQPGTKTVHLFTKSQISTGKCSKCRLHMLVWTTQSLFAWMPTEFACMDAHFRHMGQLSKQISFFLSSTPSTFDPLRGISRAWKFVSPNILA